MYFAPEFSAFRLELTIRPRASTGKDGDVAAGHQSHGFAELVFAVAHRGKRVGKVAVGQDVDGERAGEPDEVFAAGQPGEIAGQLVQRIQRVQSAHLEFEGLLLRLELLNLREGLGEGGIVAGAVVIEIGQRGVGAEVAGTRCSPAVGGLQRRPSCCPAAFRISGFEVKPCSRCSSRLIAKMATRVPGLTDLTNSRNC